MGALAKSSRGCTKDGEGSVRETFASEFTCGVGSVALSSVATRGAWGITGEWRMGAWEGRLSGWESRK